MPNAIFWAILLFILIYLCFEFSTRDNFTDVFVDVFVDATIPSIDNIYVNQPAANIIKELVQIPNRYDGYFNNLNTPDRWAPSAGNTDGNKFPLLWPLTAGTLDNRLAFDSTVVGPNYNTKSLVVTESPPTGEYIWFTGTAGGQRQIRAYNPSKETDTNNYLSGWNVPLQYGMCGNFGGNPEIHGGANVGASCNRGCDTSYREVSSPFSFVTQPSTQICAGNNRMQASPPVVHCHDPSDGDNRVVNGFDSKVLGYAWKEYPYRDPTTKACKWKTDQEAYACCTATTQIINGKSWTSEQIKDTCADAFMPSATGISSICKDFMLAMCESNWDADVCQNYLNSWEYNADVGQVVEKTIANYINDMKNKYPCKYPDGSPGTNDFTSPLVKGGGLPKGICKMPDGTARDDSKDDFINRTMIDLCTKTQEDGVCDTILQQYCAQFTRTDLSNDQSGVLQKLCGCHLPVANQGPVQECQGPRAPPTCLEDISSVIQANQYTYPGTPLACDPVCSPPDTVKHKGGKCTQTICIMNDVNIGLLNSSCQTGITINQICGDDGAGEKTGNCYINEVDVSLVNSSCGGIVLNQQCNACFTYPPDRPWDVTLVSCCDPSGKNGGKCAENPPGNGPIVTPPNPNSGSSQSWLSKHGLLIGGGIAFLGFILLMIGLIIYLTSKKDAAVETENTF